MIDLKERTIELEVRTIVLKESFIQFRMGAIDLIAPIPLQHINSASVSLAIPTYAAVILAYIHQSIDLNPFVEPRYGSLMRIWAASETLALCGMCQLNGFVKRENSAFHDL